MEVHPGALTLQFVATAAPQRVGINAWWPGEPAYTSDTTPNGYAGGTWLSVGAQGVAIECATSS